MKTIRLVTMGVLGSAFMVSSGARAEIDGWDIANLNARNSAMMQNYFSMKDDYDIWINPANIKQYPSRIYGSMSTDLNGAGIGAGDATAAALAGANIQLGTGTLGIYMGRPYTGPISNTLFDPKLISVASTLLTGAPVSTAVRNLFDVFYARSNAFGDIGARINYNRYVTGTSKPVGPNGNGTTINADKKSVVASDLNLNIGVNLKQIPLDVAVLIGLPSFLSDYGFSASTAAGTNEVVSKVATNDELNLAVAGRWDVYQSEGGAVRLSGKVSREVLTTTQNFRSSVAGVALPSADQVGEKKKRAYRAAGYTSFLLSPASGVNVIATLGVEIDDTITGIQYVDNLQAVALQTSNTETVINVVFPARLGVEVAANNNWTLRAGAARVMYRGNSKMVSDRVTNGITNMLVDTVSVDANADPAVSLGLGARYTLGESLMVDGTLNKDILHTGTYLLSGVKDSLLTQVSLIYKF